MRTRSERSENWNTKYKPSGTSSTSPVSPHHTVSDINSTLSVTGGSVRRCPEVPPSPPPLCPFSEGPRWDIPQKSIPHSLPREVVCGDFLNSHLRHCHSANFLKVPIEISRKNKLCPHWPLHHHCHHIHNSYVGKQYQVTVGLVTLLCVRFYHPMVLVNVVAVVVLEEGRPPNGPLSPWHPPNDENTKAWVWIANDESDTNDMSHSWVIR